MTHRKLGRDEVGGRERSRDRADPEGDVRVEVSVGGVGPKLLDPREVGLPGRFTARNECGQVSNSHIQRVQVVHVVAMQPLERHRRGNPKRGGRPSAWVACARRSVRTNCWTRERWGRRVSSNRNPLGGARSVAFSLASGWRRIGGSKIATWMARTLDTTVAQPERLFKLTMSRSF